MTTTDVEVTLDEAWETESGLYDEYTGTIQRSWFSTDTKYQNGEVMLLHWEILTTNPDMDAPITEKFPIGSGWDSRDGGVTVVHEKGKQKFNESSIYGKIVKRVTEPDGVLHDASTVLRGRGRPTNAGIWTGLSFDFKKEEFDYGSDIGKKSRVMPQKFLGEGAQPELPTSNGAASAPAAPPAAESNATADLDPVLAAKLRAAASAADSHQAFLDAALAIDGVASNDNLMAALVDDGPSGFYATASA